jgi:hypothetical protein
VKVSPGSTYPSAVTVPLGDTELGDGIEAAHEFAGAVHRAFEYFALASQNPLRLGSVPLQQGRPIEFILDLIASNCPNC